jgi:hypothetical protein
VIHKNLRSNSTSVAEVRNTSLLYSQKMGRYLWQGRGTFPANIWITEDQRGVGHTKDIALTELKIVIL